MNANITEERVKNCHLNGSIKCHGEVEHKVADVSSEIQHKVIKAEANNAFATEILEYLGVVAATPHDEISPPDDDAQVAKGNLMHHLDLDPSFEEILQLSILGSGLERHDTVPSNISGVDGNANGIAGVGRQSETAQRLYQTFVIKHDRHLNALLEGSSEEEFGNQSAG